MKRSLTSFFVAVTMIFGTSAGMIPASAEDTEVFEPDYSQVSDIPEGWSGSGFSVSDMGFPAFYGSDYNGDCGLFYDDIIWSEVIDYSWEHVTGYYGTAILYFFYEDSNNYYALRMNESGSSIVKNEDGEETVLGQNSTPLVTADDISVKVTRDEGGTVSVYTGEAGSEASELLYTSTEADTAQPEGKIGIGFSGGEGYMYGVRAEGQTSGTSTQPTPTPTPVVELTPASYTLTYGDTLPEGWSGDTANIATLGGWAYQHSYDGWGKNTAVVYDDIDWAGDLTYTSRVNNSGSSVGVSSYLYFYYNDSNNYYAAKFGNDEETGITLIKNVNGEIIELSRSENYIKPQNGTWFTITVTDDGISMTSHDNNSDVITTHFDNVQDTSFTNGKIGFGWDGDAAWFAELSARGYTETVTSPTPPVPTETAPASYTLTYGDTLPEGWSGDTANIATLGGWAYQHSGSGWGKNTVVVYDDIDWTGDLTYTSRVNNSGSTAGVSSYLYFYYNDANNYYAAKFGNDEATGITLIKSVNGEVTELARSENYIKPQNGTWFTITVTDDGISMTSHDNNSDVITTHFENVRDASFTSGKIGFGWDGDAAWFSEVSARGYSLTEADPTPPVEITPTSYTLTYGDTLPEGWSGDTANIATLGNWAYQHSYDGWGKNTVVVYDDINWTQELTYTSRVNNSGSTSGVSSYLYFYYNDANNYYALKLGNDEATGITLIKSVNGIVTELARSSSYAKPQEGTWYTITVNADGISVTSHRNGSEEITTHFENVQDTSFTSGKIGFGWDGDAAWFSGLSARGYSAAAGNIPTDEPQPSPSDEPIVTTGPVTFEPNYTGQMTIPAGWSGNNFSMAQNENWPAFIGEAYNTEGILIYDGYIWEQHLDYTWKQLNGYNGTAMIYFWYNDSNNYYALELSASGTRVIRVADGEEEVLGSDSTHLVNIGGDVSVRVTYSDDGEITVYSGSSNTTPTNVLYTVNDISGTDPSGKIGIGFINGGGHICSLSVSGIATNVIIEPEPSQVPTPSPTPTAVPGPTPPQISYDTQYTGYDTDTETWSGSGFEVGTWSNYTFNASEGQLILDRYLWKGALDISFTQVSVNSHCTGLIYFMYQNNMNYYALELSDDGGSVVKMDGGARTVLGYTDDQMVDNQYSLRIVRDADGVISVWKGEKDSYTQTEKLIETDPDMTYTEGKAGIGYTGRTGGTQWFVAPTFKGTTGITEEQIPLTVKNPETPDDSAVSFDPADKSLVRRLGRAYEMDGELNLAWSLSGVEFMIYDASEVYINVDKDTIFAVSIDDHPIEHVKTEGFTDGGWLKLAEFDEVSDHKIRIMKETEQTTIVNVADIKAVGNAPSLKATEERSRKIEFVGDSITVGSCMFLPGSVNERMGTNAMINYAGQTADYFGADVSMTAVGGSGFVVDDMDSLSTYRYYDYSIQPNAATGDEYKWDFTQYVPDVVVVNIGTNGGANTTKEHYIRFYEQIRDRYNDDSIKIVFALGAINQDAWPNLHAAYEELSQTDSNVYELQLGDNYVAGVASHPNLEQHGKMAETLISYLEEIMPGWDKADVSAGAYSKTGSDVTVPYRILNNAGISDDAKVMTALYDADGVLVGVRMDDVSLSDSGNIINGTAEFEDAEDAVSAKIFVWNDNNASLAQTEAIGF